jgi:hypothetical protein
MVLQNGALADSAENTHLAEILGRAKEMAMNHDNTQSAQIQALTDALIALGTLRFQDFLDRAIVPRPSDEALRHAAGQQHDKGDYFCDCWKHRACIDLLSDDNVAAEPIAQLLLMLASFVAQGVNVTLMPISGSAANVRLSTPLREFDLCIVHPFDFTADATQTAIRGGVARPKTAEPGYIVLGTSGRAGRPKLAGISQAIATPVAPLQAANATEPLLKAVYNDDLAASTAAGNLAELLQQRFG